MLGTAAIYCYLNPEQCRDFFKPDPPENVCEMARGGKQRIDNEYSREARRQPDSCKWLQALYASTRDSAERQKIKLAQKALGCRQSSGGGP